MIKNKQTKTTKHTIEFSNNTPCEWATPQLYYIVETASNPSADLSAGAVGTCLRRPYPLDLCTQNREVLDEQRIPAIDVKDVVNLGLAVGHQGG
jgi:hypothetical protein